MNIIHTTTTPPAAAAASLPLPHIFLLLLFINPEVLRSEIRYVLSILCYDLLNT